MRTQYTAGQFRRNERRITRNAKTVVDNFGCTMRITHSRRILETLNPMTGKWEGATSRDGVRYSGSPYIYVPKNVNLSPAMGI